MIYLQGKRDQVQGKQLAESVQLQPDLLIHQTALVTN